MTVFHIICLAILFVPVAPWTTDDLELFDLVEEINVNFYDFLKVNQVSDFASDWHHWLGHTVRTALQIGSYFLFSLYS